MREKLTEAQARLGDYQLLLRPVITEKSSLVGGDGSRITLRVNHKATKDEIKAAVERVFKVKVTAVRTCNMAGKAKQVGRQKGRTARWKKAYVQLAEGSKIDLVEGV